MRGTQAATAVLAGALTVGLAGLAGCAGAEEPEQARATVEVCVGTGVGREDGWVVELVQDGEVVGTGSVAGDAPGPAVPSEVSMSLDPGPFVVRYDDGTVIGDGDVAGGSIRFHDGEGCPLTP